MSDSITTTSAANRGYDPYDSSSTRNQRLDTLDIPTLVDVPGPTREEIAADAARWTGVRLAVRQAS